MKYCIFTFEVDCDFGNGLLSCRNVLAGDSLSGCWATVGVLTEKGSPRTSSTGKDYCIWKIGCLDETTISLFLFGDAYKTFCKEKAGTAFALFNCTVRKDPMVPSNRHTGVCFVFRSPVMFHDRGSVIRILFVFAGPRFFFESIYA